MANNDYVLSGPVKFCRVQHVKPLSVMLGALRRLAVTKTLPRCTLLKQLQEQ